MIFLTISLSEILNAFDLRPKTKTDYSPIQDLTFQAIIRDTLINNHRIFKWFTLALDAQPQILLKITISDRYLTVRRCDQGQSCNY